VFSSPLIADGVAYVGSWDWNVYAVDTATGRGDHFCGQR
jgi:outer membrane protein assembly factor BamB